MSLALGAMETAAWAERPSSPPPSLSDAAIERAVSEALCQVLLATQHVDLDQRIARIREVLDHALMKIELPIVFREGWRIDLQSAHVAPATGQFDAMSWTILIDSHVLRAGPLSWKERTRLVQALYHELRHAEQYYAMTCWCMDTGEALSLIHLPVPKAILWHARHAARRRVEGKRAKTVSGWFTQRASPALRTRHEAFFAAAQRVRQAQAERRRRIEALAKARLRKAPRTERKDLVARIAQAEEDLTASSTAFQRALRDYQALPLESDARRVLRRLAPCAKT